MATGRDTMYGIWVYRKQGEDIIQEETEIRRLRNLPCNTYTVYTDTEGSSIAWQAMKREIDGSQGFLLLTALTDLGETPTETVHELTWLISQNFFTMITDCPSTSNTGYNKEANAACLAGIADALNLFPDRTAFAVSHPGKGGRPRIAYPDNWENLFAQWTAGNITASECMKRSGLKKGTFYHLVQNYKTGLQIYREIKPIHPDFGGQ